MDELLTLTIVNLVVIGGAIALLLAGVMFLVRKKWPERYAAIYRNVVRLTVAICLVSVAIVWLYVDHLLYLFHLRETKQAYISGLELGLSFVFGIPMAVSLAGGLSLGIALAGLMVRPIERNAVHAYLLLAVVVTSIVATVYLGFWHFRHQHDAFMPTSMPTSGQAPK